VNKIKHALAASVTTAIITMAPLAMPTLAANNGTDRIGPLAGSSTDNGSCGAPWANDTYNLFFTIHDNGDGTFEVRTEYKDGSFVTIGGVSPGACETSNNHGTVVASGIEGKFGGWVDETVTSATYDPTACDVPAACTTRTAAIAALFPGGTESFNGFNFEYNSPDKSLKYHHWQDKSSNNLIGEQFIGDIANN
jgi:hypothetical protein